MGAKAPLSTNIDCYSLKTAHNGKEFSFLVYKDKVDSYYTKWNEDGSQNNYITFSNGFKVYYKKTDSINYVETSWDVKRHQKHQYVDAVKSQLLYFKNPIKFNIETNYGYTETVNFQASILYETEDFIIADQHYYSRPHLIVNGVCYGFIQFDELELDTKYGSIGIKVNMDDIQVTTSRESCVWNSKTKDSILRKYTCLSQTAEKYINDSLKDLNYLDWLSTCYCINGLWKSNNTNKNIKILTNLASLAGFSTLKLKYKDTNFNFKTSLIESIDSNHIETIRVIGERYYSKSGIYKTRLKYSPSPLEALCDTKKFIQYNESTPLKSLYLVKENGLYVVIRPSSRSEEEYKSLFKEFVTEKISLDDCKSRIEEFKCFIDLSDTEIARKSKSMYNGLEFIQLMIDEEIIFYEDIVVPDTFQSDLGEDEEVLNVSTDTFKTKEKIDYSKRRKENGSVLIHYPRITYNYSIIKSKTEMSIANINSFDGTLIYSFKDDEPLINLLYTVSRNKHGCDSDYVKFEGDFRVCVIARTAEKYFKEHTYVKKYMFGEDSKTLCPELIRWFTARRVDEIFLDKNSISYLKNFKEFSKEITSTYEDLIDLIKNSSSPVGISTAIKELDDINRDFIINIYFIKSLELSLGREEAEKTCKEKSIPEEYLDIEIFDKDILNKLDWVLEFHKIYGIIFSEIDILKHRDYGISPELSQEIKEIIDFKRERLELEYPDLCC